MCTISSIKIDSFWINTLLVNNHLCFGHPATYLPLEAVGSRGVASFEEASGGGPAGWVLPWWRLFRLDPWLAATKWPIDGQQGGVAAAPNVEGHIWQTGKTARALQQYCNCFPPYPGIYSGKKQYHCNLFELVSSKAPYWQCMYRKPYPLLKLIRLETMDDWCK